MRPRKLAWTEGLFITQHHFQQLDRYHEANVAEHFRATFAYEWGVSEIEFDDRALTAGQIQLKELTAILPDGTVVRCGDKQDDVPPPRPVEAAFAPQMKSLDVFIGVPCESDTMANVDLEAKRAPTRFVRDENPVLDFNTGAAEHTVAWVRRNVSFLLGEERRDAVVSVRVAQLVRNTSGQIVFRDSYVPPILKVGASSFIMAGMRRVLAAMTAKQRSLAQSRRQRSAAAIDFQASDAAKFWLLNCLNSFIPPFSHLVDSGTAQAEDAYLVLGQLIGQLCTFAVDGDPTAIPKFNYLELGDVFEPMFARAIALLNAVIAERYVQIPLQLREDGKYLGKIEDRDVRDQYSFFLAVTGSLPETQIREQLPRLAKIASWGQISPVLNSAVNGVRIEVEYHPPSALPIKPGMSFFRVQQTAGYWPDVQRTGTIAIYHPLEGASVNCLLYAVHPENL